RQVSERRLNNAGPARAELGPELLRRGPDEARETRQRHGGHAERQNLVQAGEMASRRKGHQRPHERYFEAFTAAHAREATSGLPGKGIERRAREAETTYGPVVELKGLKLLRSLILLLVVALTAMLASTASASQL